MKTSLLLGAGRGPRLAVLELVKRSGEGVSVQDLATSLGMSYMGVKSHCLALTESGHLIARRKPSLPSHKGRPRLLYILSEQGEKLFTSSQNHLALALLKEAAGLFGVTAPQKLLTMYFRSLQASYSQQINAETPMEWPRALAHLRNGEGRMALFIESSPWEIRESHNPLASLMEMYPEARTQEEHLIGEVLGVKVMRIEKNGMVVFSPLA